MLILMLELIIATITIGLWVLAFLQTKQLGILIIVGFMIWFNIHIILSNHKKEKSKSEVS